MLRGSPTILLQKLGEIKPNSLGLHQSIAKPISDSLNILLVSCYVLYHQVKKHQWIIDGPHLPELELQFGQIACHLEQIADQTASRIALLGAYPISTPRKQQEMALFHIEEEGVFETRVMLQHDVHAFQLIIVRYRETIRQTQQAGDFGTEQLLKEHLQLLENDAHKLHGVLAENQLTIR